MNYYYPTGWGDPYHQYWAPTPQRISYNITVSNGTNPSQNESQMDEWVLKTHDYVTESGTHMRISYWVRANDESSLSGQEPPHSILEMLRRYAAQVEEQSGEIREEEKRPSTPEEAGLDPRYIEYVKRLIADGKLSEEIKPDDAA